MLTDRIKQEVFLHYKKEYPKECCGLIVDEAYIPLTNVADDPIGFFEIDPLEYLQCQKLGEIKAVVHSHPDGSTALSMADRQQLAYSEVSWVITNGHNFAIHDPESYTAPLLGRDYYHGLLDCYTLFRDYYSRELGIKLGDYDRDDLWWEQKDHPSLYLDNFEKEGFVEVDIKDIQKHDVLLCRLGRTEHINHACIFIGDGQLESENTPDVVGNSLILHHPYNRQSIREVYGQQWQRRTALVIRHKSLL